MGVVRTVDVGHEPVRAGEAAQLGALRQVKCYSEGYIDLVHFGFGRFA